jgi:hypothetical protein
MMFNDHNATAHKTVSFADRIIADVGIGLAGTRDSGSTEMNRPVAGS